MFYSSPASPLTIKSWTKNILLQKSYVTSLMVSIYVISMDQQSGVITRYKCIISDLMKQEWNK